MANDWLNSVEQLNNRSTFPNQVDTFVEVYDLPASKVYEAQRLQELKLKASLSSVEQEELTGLVQSLEEYMLTPETFNKFQDSLVNMQHFFLEGVGGYIDEKQKLWKEMIQSFIFTGEYSDSKSYKFQNMVKYLGNLYICKADSKGIKPTNTAYWEKVSDKGDKGDTGLGVNYKGIYNNTTTYNLGDGVLYEGYVYYANKTTTGVIPANSSNWTCFEYQIVSDTKPIQFAKGNVWIQTGI